MNTYNIQLLGIVLALCFGCSGLNATQSHNTASQVQGDNTRATIGSDDSVPNQSSQANQLPQVNSDTEGYYDPGRWPYPLAPEWLSEIENWEFSHNWCIRFRGFDTSQPPDYIDAHIEYRPDGSSFSSFYGTILYAHGNNHNDQDYLVTFPSPQPFLDLISYISDHEDVFFDYSEFEGAEPGRYILPPNINEYFELSTSREQNIYRCIVKGTVTGQTPPEEIQYVISTIKTEFIDELIQHPDAY